MAIARKPAYVILDDFLDEDEWAAVWTEFQFMELLPVTRASGAWKLSDGVPLGGHEILTPPRDADLEHDPQQPRRYPTNTAIDAVLTRLFEHEEAYRELVGTDWERVSARAYVYPAETALSWHRDDSELYAGAFIYYAHPRWDAHWGGELLIADQSEASDLPIMAYRFETASYSEQLLDLGTGSFIAPKPNRLVLLAGAPHSVARISPAAGDCVRASVSGFFLRGADHSADA